MAKKDSYWFKHDSTAGRGLKMRKMAHIYSHWGKGVYWDVVEILRDQKNYQFEHDESSLQLLCDLVGCKHENRFLNWFNDCVSIGLFEISGKYFNCPPLLDNMEVWETKKVNGSLGGRPKNNRIKTETITELKPNQNHNRTEDKIIEYNKKEFLKDWNDLRTKHFKKPSFLNTLYPDDELLLKDLLKGNTKEDVRNAMIGLFKQKKMPNGQTTMQSNPSHFLKFFNSYLTAYHDKNDNLYGKPE